MATVAVPLLEIESDSRVRTQTAPRKARFEGDSFPIEAREFPQGGLQARYYQFALSDFASSL